jgi:hypothetical protein
LQRHRRAALLAQTIGARPSDRLFSDLARLSVDGQPDPERPASATNRSGFLKSRLYAKSLMGPIWERYQAFNRHFKHAYAETAA